MATLFAVDAVPHRLTSIGGSLFAGYHVTASAPIIPSCMLALSVLTYQSAAHMAALTPQHMCVNINGVLADYLIAAIATLLHWRRDAPCFRKGRHHTCGGEGGDRKSAGTCRLLQQQYGQEKVLIQRGGTGSGESSNSGC